ncbi:MAG: zinc ABC transporter substrate-binding protein [Candidatus Cloacimonetes bacterium]|nr:zinc ABC transporter substrate-binding protein [Candidatus Cloacimonadota bacterium]
MKEVLSWALLVLIIPGFTGCSKSVSNKEKIVFVSILPQKYFVERIAGDLVQVEVMVQPGHNPATYEVTPVQLSKLQKASLYFRVGVPFEKAWLSKLKEVNPNLQIIDTRLGMPLRAMPDLEGIHALLQGRADDHNHHGEKDPHIWLSPELVKIQAETIYLALAELLPGNREIMEQNLLAFKSELVELQKEIRNLLDGLTNRKFLVFHPSWGYFAEEFGLIQIPIEIEGKAPVARELAAIIDLARQHDIRVVFVQKQFSTMEAQAVAETIKGKVIRIDPLAENYLTNLRQIAYSFRENLN